MDTDLISALHAHFGFSSFRVGQREAIEHALARRDALVVMPTGSGKSLCYQLPALMLDGTTLVISPLIALMKDQVDALAASNKAATFINSTLSTQEQKERLARLARGDYKIVYLAPERLRNSDLLGALTQVRVALIAVDEAHCISQWGHDFRPDYQHIRDFIPRIGKPPVLALTATATPHVQSDILKQLGLERAEKIVTGFNRPNLSFTVRYTLSEEEKLRELQSILTVIASEAKQSLKANNEIVSSQRTLLAMTCCIVYTGTRREAEEVAEFVNQVARLRATPYHAGMDAAERTRAQDAFMQNEIPIIVATNAFGMGVDKPDIRGVIHFNLPATVEAYYQEVGRAGRDGKPARGVLLYSPEDRALQEWFIENDAPTRAQTENLYRLLPRGTTRISPLDLQRETGLNDTKLKLALTQLETAGALVRLGDERGAMLVNVASLVRLDLAASEKERERFRESKRQKLARMVQYAETNTCRRRFILDYFGDPSSADASDCCDNHAISADPARIAATEAESIALTILDCVRAVSGNIGRGNVSKILNGSTAKDVARFEKRPFFGKLAQFKQRELDEMVNTLIRQGFIKIIGGEYPVVALSPKGADAIKKRAAIPLNAPQAMRSPEAARAERTLGTLEFTRQLYERRMAPAEIAQARELTLGTIYDHLAQLIERGTAEIDRVIPRDTQTQIRAAMQRATVPGLTAVNQLLPETISFGELRCVRAAIEREQKGLSTAPDAEKRDVPADDPIAQFLSTARPKPLRGPWRVGFALDFNSKFVGARWERTELGELVYQFKYAGDPSIAETLAARLAELIRARPELGADLIIPIPSTKKDRAYDPVLLLARALGKQIGVAVNESALVKTRATQLQKAMTNLIQKQANMKGAFRVADTNVVRGRRVLLVDDFYDSGATLGEATNVLLAAGAAVVNVLAVTKTIHAD